MATVRSPDVLAGLTRALDARERELRCHYSVTRILEEAGDSVERVLQETVGVLPDAWQHRGDACARIVLRGRAFATPDFTETPWAQRSPVRVHGEEAGWLEVRYLSPHPPGDDGPFLHQEQELLDAVAMRIGRRVEREEDAQRLSAQEAELRKRLLHLTRVTTVGEMASSIAHEVNQPLTAISTYAQACRRMLHAEGADAGRVSQVLGRITDEALRAGEIVHRLKELVRRRESERQPCSVNALVLQVASLAQVDARLHGVALRLALASDLPEVVADCVQIQQVVLNLVRNGVDAVGATEGRRGEVLVQSRPLPEGGVLVSVSDDGCGLPDTAEEDLFQPFFTTKPDGMGMGLSISRSIIVLHGGRLWFERRLPRGTVFHFTLPAAGGDAHG